jgi:hypothetical protein
MQQALEAVSVTSQALGAAKVAALVDVLFASG